MIIPTMITKMHPLFIVILIILFLGSNDIPSGLITLVCFLPMVFYFSERSANQKISRLEARMIVLEKMNKSLFAAAEDVSS